MRVWVFDFETETMAEFFIDASQSVESLIAANDAVIERLRRCCEPSLAARV
jgi:hypothetical protein